MNVIRNINTPEFKPSEYSRTIDFNKAVGEEVESVYAEDTDERVYFNSLSYFVVIYILQF